MIVLKCDRCGLVADEVSQTGWYRVNVTDMEDFRQEKLGDLCPACSEEHIKWLNPLLTLTEDGKVTRAEA